MIEATLTDLVHAIYRRDEVFDPAREFETEHTVRVTALHLGLLSLGSEVHIDLENGFKLVVQAVPCDAPPVKA